VNPSPFEKLDEGYTRPAPADDESGIRSAVDATNTADIAVVVAGEAQDMIGESASRSSLELPGRQRELINALLATGKPVVLLLMSGRPLDINEIKVPAILNIWYPGSQGGAAVANLLFGDAVPGGKLPFSWPCNVGQVPLIYSHLTTHDPKNIDKRYWNESNAPAWPFGFGLSYSTFSFSNVRVDQARISPTGEVVVKVDLKNTGMRKADEVAQLYIHQRVGTAARPVRELKGFQRVTLKPGEARTLSFTLATPELRYWNAAVRNWVVDESVVDVGIGADSTVPFSATFEVSKSQ
jgi:beta-glucosidase